MTQRQTKKILKLDATTTWTDQGGRTWTVGVELKHIGGKVEVVAIMLEPVGDGYPITRRTLAQLPLRDLFADVMYEEDVDFAKWRQSRRRERVHQGKASSDEELALIAEVRLAALRANVPVQRAVAQALGISEGTAGNRIKVARERGFVPPTNGEKK